MYNVILVSGVQYSDPTLPYNTWCSSQQVHPLIPITHLTHPPTHCPFSLFFIVKSLFLGLFPSLPLFSLSHLFCWFYVFSLFCTDVPLRLFARLLSKLASWGYFKKHAPCASLLKLRTLLKRTPSQSLFRSEVLE